MAVPGSIRCADCSGTGQRPAAPTFDEVQIGLTAQPRPAFRNNRTDQIAIIARVLLTSPLVLETLDFQDRVVDTNLQVVGTDVSVGRFPALCGIVRAESVDLRSKTAWSMLQFNDLITARWIYKRNERNPADFSSATLVLTEIRKLSEPVPYFHTTPVHESCANRSGRLLIYYGPVVDRVVVFNDGSISYRNALFRNFAQERLSPVELADLLKAFGAANFDRWPTTVPTADSTEQSTLTLLGTRYQNVSIVDRESALAPLVRRMDDLAARATARTELRLTAGRKSPIAILEWPYSRVGLAQFRDRRNVRNDPALLERLPERFSSGYFRDGGRLFRVSINANCRAEEPTCGTFSSLEVAEVVDAVAALKATGLDYRIPGSLLGGKSSPYLWTADMGVKLGAVPASGIVIGRDEYEKHRPVYFELLKAKAAGLSFVDDGFLYEQVRLCQSEPGAANDCWQ